MSTKNYVVYCRGILRYEGQAEDGCDYMMEGGRPRFHSSLNENDRITIFVYTDEHLGSGHHHTLLEKRDYVCLDTPAGELMRAKDRTVTKF